MHALHVFRTCFHADKYREIARFSTWVFTIATNLVRDHFRKNRREYEMPPEVLTATTPISLSAFADGRDDGAGAAHAAGARRARSCRLIA